MGKRIYIIFTGTITRMGGAQMYVNNKVNYLKKDGWYVSVFSGLTGPVLIDGLKEYEKTIKPEFSTFPFLFRKTLQDKYLGEVIQHAQIEQDDYVVIESNSVHSAFWGELLAKKIRGKHFLFLLDEEYSFPDSYLPFFEEKYNRKELAVIKEKAFKALFRNSKNVEFVEDSILVAPCNNVVADINDSVFDTIKFDQYDFVCLSLGRLNKKYIPNVYKGFSKFSEKHQNSKILYIFIGNQPEDWPVDVPAQIEEELGNLENVDLFMAGYVFPIPRSLFTHIDLAVASAGSSWVLLRENVPAVSMDANDGQPIGIIGYTTMNSLYRENELIVPLEDYMDKILCDSYLSDKNPMPLNEATDDEYMDNHMLFLQKSENSKEYFDVSKTKLSGAKDRVKKFLISILGIERYKRLAKKKQVNK